MNGFRYVDDFLIGSFERFISDPLTRAIGRSPFWFAATCCLLIMGANTLGWIEVGGTAPAVGHAFYYLSIAVMLVAFVRLDSLDKRAVSAERPVLMSPFRPFIPFGVVRIAMVVLHLPDVLVGTAVMLTVLANGIAVPDGWWTLRLAYVCSSAFLLLLVFFASATTKKPPPEREEEKIPDGAPERT